MSWLISRNFKKPSLHWLLKQDYKDKPDLVQDLLKFGGTVFVISDRIDLLALIMGQSMDSVDDILSKYKLTLNQMDHLATKMPQLWGNNIFVCLYLSLFF